MEHERGRYTKDRRRRRRALKTGGAAGSGRKARMMGWALFIPAVILLLIIVIVKMDIAENSVSRAMASKAMALALADRETCLSSQREHGSHFKGGDQESWYAKYMDYLLEEGYLETEGEADSEFALGALTYGEAAYAAEQVKPGLSDALNISRKKYGKPIPKEEWQLFYESFLAEADPEGKVTQESLFLYGTPENVSGASPWTAYTSRGVMGFEGESLDAYIDHEITVLCRGSEIIRLTEDVSDQVTYRNVWLVPDGAGRMKLYIGTIAREFPLPDGLAQEDGALADVSLEKGEIKKLSLKNDTVEGKVLAVREDSIEIEGYGTLKLDADFKVYKTYGVVREQRKSQIVVGYDLGKFVVADQKICAALLTKSFSAKNIRVLIMNTGFSSIFHEEIALRSECGMRLTYHGKEETVEAGASLILKADDARLKEGRLRIEPLDPQKEITVAGISRRQGAPSYFGSFEVMREPEGLLLLNELDIEDYLTRVVPSEMLTSFELEALKAQAVCARTYAYRQIQANYYSQYGAHVDDSTNYQVYNDEKASERTDRAVKETEGKLVFYGGEPVETFYFSTSCGYSTDGTIWGAAPEDVPYLKGFFLNSGRKAAGVPGNEEFSEFIRGQGSRNYDSDYPLYRWKTTVTSAMIEEKAPEIGRLQAIMVTERGIGGIAKAVKLIGSEGEKTLKGQTPIRSTLGSRELVYTRNDASTMTDWASLPSAFIDVDETARDEETGIRTFTIWGGGYGHGVGMSQNGAQQMAKEGEDYEAILTFFFDGVEVKEVEG